MTAPRRIVHVISSLAVGGAQGHLLQLLAEPTDGVQQDVIYFRDHDLRADAERLAGRVHHVPMAGPWEWTRLPQLTAAIARGRYDVVHTHLLRADMYGALAARAARVPGLVATKHNLEARLEHPVWRWLHRRTAGMPDVTIGISDAVRAWAVTTGGVPAAKTRVVLYGIDAAPFANLDRSGARAELGIEAGARVVLCPARLDPQKNHGMLLRAFERVHREQPDAVLLLAGGRQLGSELYERDLHALADLIDADGAVRWLGVRSDMSRLLAACDVVALASDWEGFGLALLEAMAAGRPVVATAVGGVPEVVSDGESGILVAAGDMFGFAKALIRLLDDDAARRRMGTAAARRAREAFAIDRMRTATQAVYDEMLGAPA
ncbi:MAG: glycosyltransferase [Chloroflexota bacterium]|nr:glycosyltransferase [Chloroflexota bacterium]